MLRDGRVEGVQIQARVLQDRGDVAFLQDTGLLSAQVGWQEYVLFLKTDLAFGTAGHVEHAGVDKCPLTLVKGVGAAGQHIFQDTVPHIEDLHFTVPVPGEGPAGKIVDLAQIGHVGEFRGNAPMDLL